MPRSSSVRIAAAVSLLSCSALLFQVAQTRLFSATLGYHLTFVAVSIALLGVGVGAAAATLIDRRPSAPSTSRLAAFASASYVRAMAVARASAGRTYAADLGGAAVGGLLAFLATPVLGAPGECGAAAALASA